MRALPLVLTATALIPALGAAAAPAAAADLNITVEIPRIASASYHRPYVAMWVERADGTNAQTLQVWYDMKLANEEGKDWLKDLRSWWRKGGRAQALPADGVSGATRAPGRQTVTIPAARLRNLPAGQYNLVVEAARELGGREAVRVPFRWGAANTASGAGSTELGAVRVTVSR